MKKILLSQENVDFIQPLFLSTHVIDSMFICISVRDIYF